RTAFQLAFQEDFKVIACKSPAEAMALLRGQTEVAVIIADERMSEPGGKFLAESRLLRPAAVRMLITAYSDLNAAITAINEGRISGSCFRTWASRQVAEQPHTETPRVAAHYGSGGLVELSCSNGTLTINPAYAVTPDLPRYYYQFQPKIIVEPFGRILIAWTEV